MLHAYVEQLHMEKTHQNTMWNCRSAGLQLSSGLLSACGLKSASHWSCRDSHVLPCHLYKHFLLLSSAFSGSQAVHVMSVPNSFDLRQFAMFNSAFLALMHVCSASIRKFHARLSFDVRSHRRQFNLFSCVKEALVTTQILLQIVDPSAGDNRQLLQKKCRCRGTGCGRAGGGVHLVLCFSRGLFGKPQTHGEKAKRFLSPRAKIIGLHCVFDLSRLRNGVEFGVEFGVGFGLGF